GEKKGDDRRNEDPPMGSEIGKHPFDRSLPAGLPLILALPHAPDGRRRAGWRQTGKCWHRVTDPTGAGRTQTAGIAPQHSAAIFRAQASAPITASREAADPAG